MSSPLAERLARQTVGRMQLLCSRVELFAMHARTLRMSPSLDGPFPCYRKLTVCCRASRSTESISRIYKRLLQRFHVRSHRSLRSAVEFRQRRNGEASSAQPHSNSQRRYEEPRTRFGNSMAEPDGN
jgi:hypothetical protein